MQRKSLKVEYQSWEVRTLISRKRSMSRLVWLQNYRRILRQSNHPNLRVKTAKDTKNCRKSTMNWIAKCKPISKLQKNREKACRELNRNFKIRLTKQHWSSENLKVRNKKLKNSQMKLRLYRTTFTLLSRKETSSVSKLSCSPNKRLRIQPRTKSCKIKFQSSNPSQNLKKRSF